jgi:dTDP-4-dehydrorhamnose reductase
MRILVLGGDGMLGHKVYQVLAAGHEVAATFLSASGAWTTFPMYEGAAAELMLGGVDAGDFHTVVRAVARARAQVVINCIGIIKQLEEANDPILALTVNAVFPHRLADLCAATGARLIHMSTDCVFSGRKGRYTEGDVSDAEDLYGRSKYLGEVDRPGCLTIRTSIIGRDFLKQSALLEWFLAQRGGRVRGYRNAVFSGLTTQALARVMGDLIERHADLHGVVQVASEPITKLDLLSRIRDAMGLDVTIEPYDDPRCDRSLDPARFVAATGNSIPTWDEMVAELAADVTPYDDWRRRHVAA